MAYTDKSFLEKLKPYVIADMRESKILASLTAAQAFIESNKGNSGLTVQCNNLFGIKGAYNGQSGYFMTTEYYNGVKTRVKAAFRKYPSWQESIKDHSDLFNRMKRYANLRGETDYHKACIFVKQDGYATSPTYTQTLLNVIEKYQLYNWDREVLGQQPISQPTAKDQKATEKINTLPTLKIGSKNEYVLHWQKFLNANGYDCGMEDGYFGVNTKEAVQQFQISRGIKADGIIGPQTWNALNLA